MFGGLSKARSYLRGCSSKSRAGASCTPSKAGPGMYVVYQSVDQKLIEWRDN